MPIPVNLDALIRREDFEVMIPSPVGSSDDAEKLKIVELEKDSLMFKLLRKPDFQRTTAHWAPDKVANFIKSFLSGDLIPALIFWRSNTTGNFFVIDGAHRLSALIAWVHDDYGDRELSQKFFEGYIPKEQKGAADATRTAIATTVGSYVELKHGHHTTPERLQYASTLAAGGVTLQWVRGDASRAERSFHTINTEQTPIGELEVRMIRDRRCPNVMATRALVRAGTALQFASAFSPAVKEEIHKLASEAYDDLFVPPLETPIKTLDLPVAGGSYSDTTMKLILDVVEFVNKLPTDTSEVAKTVKAARRKGKPDILAPTMPEDKDGSATVTFLKAFRKASSRIAGTSPGSLGLHPAVYFYSATGNYQPTAFLAAISFTDGLAAESKLNEFTKNRDRFEELLLKYKYFINQIVKQYGSGQRGLTSLTRLYRYFFDGIVENKPEETIIPLAQKDDRLAFLAPIVDYDKGTKKEFSSERKSEVFLKQAIESATRCAICNARIHLRSLTFDHMQDKSQGGTGVPENAQLTHPYCNSTYKSWLQENAKQ